MPRPARFRHRGRRPPRRPVHRAADSCSSLSHAQGDFRISTRLRNSPEPESPRSPFRSPARCLLRALRTLEGHRIGIFVGVEAGLRPYTDIPGDSTRWLGGWDPARTLTITKDEEEQGPV